IEQPNGTLERRWTQMHVALRPCFDPGIVASGGGSSWAVWSKIRQEFVKRWGRTYTSADHTQVSRRLTSLNPPRLIVSSIAEAGCRKVLKAFRVSHRRQFSSAIPSRTYHTSRG